MIGLLVVVAVAGWGLAIYSFHQWGCEQTERLLVEARLAALAADEETQP